VRTGHARPFEKEYVRKDGSRVPVLVGAAVIVQEPLRWITFALDITARKQAEAERERLLRDAQEAHATAQAALALRDDFLGTIAHDLRTPLTTIHGLAQLVVRQLGRDATVPRELEDKIARIDAKALQMTAQLAELLDLTLQTTGAPLDLTREDVDLVALVRQAATDFADQRSIVVETPTPSLKGHWDKLRIERVVLNLLSNALKYSLGDAPIALAVAAEPGAARLTVRDTGIGIPAQDLPHIFDRFHRGANVRGMVSGTGIGLAGVKQIVEQHGGSIRVESVEGCGTTVHVRLPLRSD
jgi:signal transduction histidine kinase